MLKVIIVPNGVTSIRDSAFSGCNLLESITIPDNVTSIGNYAFAFCYALKTITVPNGVTSIGSYAFQNCYAVKEYHLLPATPPTLSATNAFSNIDSETIIYVPSESLEDYKTASNWSSYASYMQGE